MRTCTTCGIDKEEEEFHYSYKKKGLRRSICRTCMSKYQREHKPQRRANANASNKRLRQEVLMYYSHGLMKCNCCGESQNRFLCMDHINNDGAKHRAKIGKSNLYKDLKSKGYPTGFQVLCFNCNCGKAYNHGVCPHEEI